MTSYAWDFGDGQSATGVTTSHTFAAGGTYPVQLTVTDNASTTSSTTLQVQVVDSAAAGDRLPGRCEGLGERGQSPRSPCLRPCRPVT